MMGHLPRLSLVILSKANIENHHDDETDDATPCGYFSIATET